MARINKIRVNDVEYDIGGSGGTGGLAQWPETRYRNHNDYSNPPDIKVTERIPTGWELYPLPLKDGEYTWMTTAIIDSNNNLSGPTSEWSKPVRITGLNGEQGPSGIPGIDLEMRYSIGTKSSYEANWDEIIKKKRNPASDGWSITYPKVTPEKPQIWFIQARILHTEIGDEGILEDGVWTDPSPWSGGGSGPQGSKGQIIYPAGVYDVNTEYKSDEFKAPYVFVPATDPSQEGRQFPAGYYILRAKQWKGIDHGNKTPAQQDYIDNSSGAYWTKMEEFRAIYADIGVFGNALVGGAVFNGYYMFSQQGISKTGSQVTGSTHYEKFNPKDPFNKENEFRPNFCINFLTGEVWSGAGKIYFNKEGGGHLANKNISWDNSGECKFNGDITCSKLTVSDIQYFNAPGLKLSVLIGKNSHGLYKKTLYAVGGWKAGDISEYSSKEILLGYYPGVPLLTPPRGLVVTCNYTADWEEIFGGIAGGSGGDAVSCNITGISINQVQIAHYKGDNSAGPIDVRHSIVVQFYTY